MEKNSIIYNTFSDSLVSEDDDLFFSISENPEDFNNVTNDAEKVQNTELLHKTLTSNFNITDKIPTDDNMGDFSFSESIHENLEEIEKEYLLNENTFINPPQCCNDRNLNAFKNVDVDDESEGNLLKKQCKRNIFDDNATDLSDNNSNCKVMNSLMKVLCKGAVNDLDDSNCNMKNCLQRDKDFVEHISNDQVNHAHKRNSLLSAIKGQLKCNASLQSDNNRSVLKTKEETIQSAIHNAEEMQALLSETDIGPFYGLPSKMQTLLKENRGIDHLYKWQHECLTLSAIKERKSLIYSLPTSGGKTLVAEIIILRYLLCHLKDAIFVLPYISIVQEKVRSLAPFAVELNFVVEEYAGNRGSMPPRKRRHRHAVYICTIEKAHSLVNSLIENKRIEEIGVLVVDELHMLGEKGRGTVLESLLTKVLYTAQTVQIIGMSATLSNMQDLQEFLHAELFCRDFRPVELREFVKVGNQLWEFSPKLTKSLEQPILARTLDFKYTPEMIKKDPDFITGLVMEVVPQHSCLIFCPTKKYCENIAILLFEMMPKSLKEFKFNEKRELYNALSSAGNGNVCSILSKTIQFGVAYHHSGLTMEERKLIEEAYIIGTLCCLACTSTLAAGVNLPAKRVILRAPYIGREFLTISRYKQMVGRAGRAGIDTSGESILIIKPGEESQVQSLLTSKVESCQSDMLSETRGLQMILLSLIGLKIASSFEEIYNFIDHTLAAIQCRQMGSTPTNIFQETITILMNNGLVSRQRSEDGRFSITKLGRASLKGMINLSNANDLFEELRLSLQSLSLHSHLHLLYLVTPVDQGDFIQLLSDVYFQRYMALNLKDQQTAENIGISESIMVQFASGRHINSDKKVILHRFYLTLILYDLWQQNSVWSVSQRYHIHRGMIYNLLNSAGAFGASLVHFCQELDELWAYQLLLPNFVKQLSYCATIELIPLMELPGVKRGRAKQLYSSGFKTVSDIAKANPQDMVSKIDNLPYRVAKQIVSAAKMMLLEKAEALQEEAQDLISGFENGLDLTISDFT